MTVIVNAPPKFTDLPQLPEWVPPFDTGQPSAQDLNNSADTPRTNFAARNSTIPIPYGRGRFFGQPFVITLCEATGCLLVAYGLGEGEIEGYEQVVIDNNFVLNGNTAYVGIKDRGFESGTSNHWTGADSIDDTNPRTGSFSAAVTSAVGGPNLFSDYTPVPPEGTAMRFSAYAQRDSAALPDANASIAVRWYDASLVPVGGRDSGTPAAGQTNAALLATSTWQYLETIATVPATAAFYRVDFGESNGTTGRWYCDDIDVRVLAVDNASLSNDAMEVVPYTGAPGQVLDSLLARTLVGFQDDYPGLAYVVGRFPPNTTSGFPRLEMIYQGRKVYDPRLDTTNTDAGGSGAHREDDPSTWEYTSNPALCFRDMILNFSGWDILDAGVAELADYNDEIVDGHPRREIGLNISRPQTVERWTKTFRTYMGGFIGWEDGAIRVVPNRAVTIPADITLSITADDIVKDSMRVRRRSLRNTPNTVAVDYVDSSSARWRTERVIAESARVVSGDELRRLSRVSLPGIHNATQAQREATERLNWYLTDLEITFTMFDTGWQLQTGSVIEVTHPIGLTAKLFRVTRLTGQSGRWTIDATEYDPAVYSDEVVSDPTVPDTNLGNPLSPPLPSNVVAAEELFTKKDGTTGSRIRITYDRPLYAFFSQFLVEGYVDGLKVYQINTQSNEVVTPGVEQLVVTDPVSYEVRVAVQSPFATGPIATDSVLVQGKLAPPADVSTLNAERRAADIVELEWSPVLDIDIWRYEVRQGTTSDTWETATFIDLMDDIRTVVSGVGLGTYRFFVKAIDSVRNESPNAKFVDITLQAPTAVATLTGFEVASEVRLSWQRPVGGSGFVERYRIAYDTIPPSNEITLDVVDTLRFQTKDVPEGTWRFLVYSQDGAGNEALTAATADIEVTSDADAFLADTYQFVQATDQHALGSITNMHEYFLRLDDRLLYVTNMGDVFLSSPSDFNTYSAEPLANYHASGSSEWLSETKDFGLLLTGSWNLSQDVQTLNGSVEVVLELSSDDVTYTPYQSAAKGEFRYARVRITALTDSTAWVRSPVMNVRINVVPLEESGEGVSSGLEGTPSVVLLEREYTSVKEVNTQPKNNTDALMAVVDNIVVGSNTAVKGDGTNWLTGGDVLDYASSSFTIEFMAQRSATQTGLDINIIAKRQVTGGIGYVIRADLDTDEINMVMVDDAANTIAITTTTDVFPNDGNFYRFSWVVDRGTDVIRLYRDGVEVTGSPWSISTLTGSLGNTGDFRVFDSAQGGGGEFAGSIDDIRVWGDVRSASEISENWNITLNMTVTQDNLDAYMLCDGAVGVGVATTGTPVPDITGNGNDLVANSAGLVFTDPGSTNPLRKRNSFDVYVFDIFGQQLSEAYQWNWKAV